jgi:hypothetical protein
VIKSLGVLLGLEVTILLAPIGDGAGDAMDELADGSFAAVIGWIGALGDVTVEIFRDGDLGGEDAPALGDFDVLLLEDRLARIIGDLGGALFPFDFVVGMDAGLGEGVIEGQAATLELGLGGCFARHHSSRVNTGCTCTCTTTGRGLGRNKVSAANAGHGGFHRAKWRHGDVGATGYPAVRFLPYKVARCGGYYY